jgi:GR25 family glycosyltransferase involved in LPS biosynthesis
MNTIDKIFIINLDKDIERYENCKKQLVKYNINNYERFPGIDGSKLTEKERKNVTSDIGNLIASPSMIGCGISHINLWKKIIREGIDKALILEDDFILKDNFIYKFDKAVKHAPENYDMIFLTDNLIHNKNIKFKDINAYFYKQIFISQTLAYIITIEGAKKILEYINKITNHIDIELCLLALYNNNINVISMKEPLVYQTYDTSNNTNDFNFPLFIEKYILTNKDIKYFYKTTGFTIFGLNISMNGIIIILLGFFNIKLAFILIVTEYLLFIDKKIKNEAFIYLLIGYLLKQIYNGIVLSKRNR